MAELSFGLKVWADITNLTKSLTKGKEEVSSFGKNTDRAFKDLTKSVAMAEQQFKKLAVQHGVNSSEAKKALKEYSKLKGEINGINGALKGAGQTSSGFDQLSGGVSKLAVAFAAVSGYAAMAYAAIKGVGEVMAQTDSGALELEAKTAGVKAGFMAIVDSGAEVLNGTRQVSEIFDGLAMSMQRAGLAADAYTRAMDAINDRNDAFVAQEARMRNEIAKLQFTAKDQTKSETERKDALEKSLKLERDIVDFKRTQAKKAYEEELKRISQRFFISDKVIRKIIESDREEIERLVKKHKVAAKAWDKLYGAGGEGKKLSSMYADWISMDTKYFEENKRTQSQITGFIETGSQAGVKALQELEKEYDRLIAQEKSRKAFLEQWQGGGVAGPLMGTVMGDFAAAPGLTKMQGKGTPSVSSAGTQGLSYGASPLDASPYISKMTEFSSAIDAVIAKGTGLSTTFQNVFESFAKFSARAVDGFKTGWNDTMNSIGGMVQSTVGMISELFSQQNNQRLTELDQQYEKQRSNIENSKMSEKAKAKALEKLEADTNKKRKELMREQAKNQKTSSLMQAIVGGALAVVNSFSMGGPMGIIMGILMAGLVAAQIDTIARQPLPALAEGGLASAPTLAMVGDNPNARIDPEVISPLSKLKELMFGSGGGQMETLVATVRGDDLQFVLNRANRNSQRKYGF